MSKVIKNIHASFLFFSRIKLPIKVDISEIDFSRAALFLPFVGIVVAILSYVLCYAIFLLTSSYSVYSFLLVALPVVLTGGFHEDGFADFHDGFGGGYSKNKILNIMKDSFIGVYGVISLVLLIIFKLILLIEIPSDKLLPVYLLTHSLSRSFAVSLMFDLDYARSENSKAKIVVKKITFKELCLLMLTGALPIILSYSLLMIIPFLLILRFIFKKYIYSRIGGYTGDCLGALEQYSEIIILLISLTMANKGLLI